MIIDAIYRLSIIITIYKYENRHYKCFARANGKPFQDLDPERAMEKGLAEVHFHNIRDWSIGKHRQIDDEPYGGGAGMIMMVEPLDKCISELKSQRDYDEIIYLTPDGETLNQKLANTLSIQKISSSYVAIIKASIKESGICTSPKKSLLGIMS